MRRSRILAVATSAAAALAAGGLAAASAQALPSASRTTAGLAGSWGRAIGVPGLAALNKGGVAGIDAVSCASAGNCAAGGQYADRSHHFQGFVVSESKGVWGKAVEVSGLASLNRAGDAEVDAVACPSAGNCAAGGYFRYFQGSKRYYEGFVVRERSGRWGPAVKVPGIGDPAVLGYQAGVTAVSCGSPGNCVAGGYGAVVISEINGRWSRPVAVPGLQTLNTGADAAIESVSCASAGNCAAGGYYTDSDLNDHGFVVSEKSGRWGRAIEVPGLGALGKKAGAHVWSVSCGSAGNCAAGGNYGGHGFVVSERKGTWGRAMQVPGLKALGGSAAIKSISCASAANCAAGGTYGWPYWWAFVVTEKHGVWGRAFNVPGLGHLVTGRYADFNSVSCGSPGNCAIGGDYEQISNGDTPGYLVTEKNGTWGRAINVPGIKALGASGGVSSVSCPPAGRCVAGGYYLSHKHFEGFVT